jgi:hypothetical protein
MLAHEVSLCVSLFIDWETGDFEKRRFVEVWSKGAGEVYGLVGMLRPQLIGRRFRVQESAMCSILSPTSQDPIALRTQNHGEKARVIACSTAARPRQHRECRLRARPAAGCGPGVYVAPVELR